MKRIPQRIAASIGLDVELRLGTDEPLGVALAEKSGRQVPRVSIQAYGGGTIRQWWSEVPVVVDLAGMRLPRNHTRLVLLRDHDASRPLGNATAIRKTPTDLSLDGECTVPGEDTSQFVAASHSGFPWRASIGAGSLKVRYIEKGDVLRANGREFPGPVVHVVECELREVSVVTMGADDETESVAASDEEKSKIMKRIRASAAPAASETTPPASATAPDIGAATQAPVPPVQASATAGQPGTTPAPAAAAAAEAAGADAVQALRQRMAEETARLGAIRAVAGITPTIEARAIRDGWSAERAELEVLRAGRPQAPGVFIPSQPDVTPDVLAAAVCQASGLGSLEQHFQPRALEAAQTAFRGRIGLQQLIVTAAQRAGYNGSPFLRGHTELREAIRAAFSTTSLSSVLSTAANRFVMDAFNHVEQAWRSICAINQDVQDFREYTTYAFTGDLTFEPVGPDGKLAHGKLSDTSYANQIDTYAKMIAITRKDIINDDIGILRGTGGRLGRGAGLKFNTVFWAEFLNNAAFFTADRSNYFEGANTALSSASLGTAHTKFLKQVGPDGTPLGLTPAILLTPVELATTAMELLTSTGFNTGGSATTEKVPNRNIWAGKFRQATSSYLSNATLTGNSATAWYLLADPADMPVIEAGFLRGAVAPTIEDVKPDADELGIAMRGYWDFGVRKQVYQAGVKSKGAA